MSPAEIKKKKKLEVLWITVIVIEGTLIVKSFSVFSGTVTLRFSFD